MFGMTRQERQVFLFLVAAGLVGAGADFFFKTHSSVKSIRRFVEELELVDLNTADKQLLRSLPGVGEKIAQRIIEYRNRQGRFSSKEELKDVEGITGYRYERIEGSVIVRAQE